MRESETVLVSWRVVDSPPSPPDSRYYPASKLSGALWWRGGKRKVSLQIRLWNLNFHLQCTGGSPSTELSGFIQSARRGNARECVKDIEKHVPRVLTSLLMSSPPISTSHRHFRCRSIFKFQRRICKLSYLFPPRHQSASESLLAGYLGTGFLSLSIDCC